VSTAPTPADSGCTASATTRTVTHDTAPPLTAQGRGGRLCGALDGGLGQPDRHLYVQPLGEPLCVLLVSLGDVQPQQLPS
jgi:hypothetical protein